MAATRYFPYAFAISGTTAAVPTAVAPDGSMSYAQGYTSPYQLPITDPAALPPIRTQLNQVLQDITANIQQYQQFGAPNFISTSDNLGTPFSYSKGVVVLFTDGNYYQSLVNGNTTIPPSTSWALFDQGSNTQAIIYNAAAFSNGLGVVANGSIVAWDPGGPFYFLSLDPYYATEEILPIGIADVTNARVFGYGLTTALFTGLVPGAIYYISSTVRGGLSTQPSSVKLGVAYSTTQLFVDIQFLEATQALSINSNLQIWQRGTNFTFTINGIFPVADMWAIENNGTPSTINIDQIDLWDSANTALSVAIGALAGNNRYVMQCSWGANGIAIDKIYAGANTLNGKTVTFTWTLFNSSGTAIVMDFAYVQYFGTGGSPSATVESSVGPSITIPANSGGRYSVTINLPPTAAKTFGTDGNSSLRIVVQSATAVAGSGLIVINHKEDEGLISTPYQSKTQAQELFDCMGFAESGYELGIPPGTANAEVNGISPLACFQKDGVFVSNPADLVVVAPNFKVPKRIPPTVTWYSAYTGAANTVEVLTTAAGGTRDAAVTGVSNPPTTFNPGTPTLSGGTVSTDTYLLWLYFADTGII